MNFKSRSRGFTLIELMITIAVVSILATISVTNYRRYIQRTHRTEATASLLSIRVAQEKFFLQNDTYATQAQLAVAPPNGLGIPVTSYPGGYYNLRIVNVDPRLDFTVVATPVATKGQTGDKDCQTLGVNQSGLKTAMDGLGADTALKCWR